MRLMIVDDEARIVQGLTHIISNMDTAFDELAAACTVSEAMSQLKERRADLMIVDINMPGMSGLELIRAIKQQDYCRRFCILSGYSDFEYARTAMDLGCMRYLLKPVDKGELLQTLHECAELIQDERLKQNQLMERRLMDALFSALDCGELPLYEKALLAVCQQGGEILSSSAFHREAGVSSDAPILSLPHLSAYVLLCPKEQVEPLCERLKGYKLPLWIGICRAPIANAEALRAAYRRAAVASLCARWIVKRPVVDIDELEPLSAFFGERAADAQALASLDKGLVKMAGAGLHDMIPTLHENPYVQQMQAQIRQHSREKFTLRQAARSIGLSPDYAGKLFKDVTKTSFHDALNCYRVMQATQLIVENPRDSFEAVAAQAGFPDVRSFYRLFYTFMHVTPGQYKKEHTDQ